MNQAKKITLIILVIFSFAIIIPTAQALGDCEIHNRDEPPTGMKILGYVSTTGHFANESPTPYVNYLKALFCNEALAGDRTDGGETIYFSDPNQEVAPGEMGSGHVSITNNTVSFGATRSLGFEEGQCEIRTDPVDCNSGEICVFKISDVDQGHIGDCNNNNEPSTHNFQHKLCCTPTEYCRDGRDNTGDGLIDCASPECHPSPINFDPIRCDPKQEYLDAGYGNWQNTSGCVIGYNLALDKTIFNSSCIGTNVTDIGFTFDDWPIGFSGMYEYPIKNASYYCSYGINDDGSQTSGQGFCCPTGTRAEFDEGVWDCVDFDQCGMDSSLDCDDDYRLGPVWGGWLGSFYDGVDDDWCVSMLPNFYNPITQPVPSFTSSMGCCFVPHYGEFGFYHKADNIKTFGTK